MDQHQHHSHEQRAEDLRRGAGEQEDEDREHREHDQHHLVGDEAAEDRERLVAEEVEEEPDRHHHDEDDERDRVPEEAEEDDHERHEGVVHAEVGEVRLHTSHRLAEGPRQAEAVDIDELAPRAARAEAGLEAVLGA